MWGLAATRAARASVCFITGATARKSRNEPCPPLLPPSGPQLAAHSGDRERTPDDRPQLTGPERLGQEIPSPQLQGLDRPQTPTGFTLAGAAATSVSQRRQESGNEYAGWGSAFHPTSREGVLGGFGGSQRTHHWDTSNFAGTATVNGAATPFTQVGTPATPDSAARFAAFDLGIVAARRLPSLDAGLLVHYHESSSRGVSRYERLAVGLAPDSEYSLGRGESALAEIVAGIAFTNRRGIEWSWAVGYRYASADLRDLAHTLNAVPSPLATVHEASSGWHTELRARQRLSANWSYGASLRAVFLDGHAAYSDSTGLPFVESITDRFYRLGVGLGYTPSPRTAFGLDLVGGLRREDVLQRYLSGNTCGRRSSCPSGLLVTAAGSARRPRWSASKPTRSPRDRERNTGWW